MKIITSRNVSCKDLCKSGEIDDFYNVSAKIKENKTMKIITSLPIISTEGKILAQSGEARIIPATNDDYKGEFDFVDYSFAGEKDYYDFEGQENFCGADGKPIKPLTEEDDDFFSSADGDKKAQRQAKKEQKKATKEADKKAKESAPKKEKTGLGKTLKKWSDKFKTFLGNRKVKRNARKLKRIEDKKSKNAGKHADVLPPLEKVPSKDGSVAYQKTKPDGTPEILKQEDVATGQDGKIYAKEDLKTDSGQVLDVVNNEATGEKELVKVIPEDQVETLQTTDGEAIPFKKDDVIDKDAPDEEAGKKKGMSNGLKIGLIVGGVLVLLGVMALVLRSGNKTVVKE